ncbi:hypothetical protein [Sphingosinicella sp. CPCC 101087]|uniref:hypothetical protein n=1 Tax=Sphingosinicella sp. CPCC 101087 TaxID=2497754 RepID=UPI001981D235|nr:hypothetical protein [Sphingosinicella sp. CPCC 101087]
MQDALDLSESHPTVSLVVSDADAVAACLKFADFTHVLVEPVPLAGSGLDMHGGRRAGLACEIILKREPEAGGRAH